MGEEATTEEQREDCETESGARGEEPDEENEEPDANAEERWDVEGCELLVFTTVESVQGIGESIEAVSRLVDFDESAGAFGDADLVGCRGADVASGFREGWSGVVSERCGFFFLFVFWNGFRVRFCTFIVEEVPPAVADEVTLFILHFLVEEEMRKTECSGALPEPPLVHRFDAF